LAGGVLLPVKKYRLTYVARVLLRPWWILLLGGAAGAAVSVVAYQLFPTYYRSETWIGFGPVVSEAAGPPTALSITEQILSAENLQAIVSEFELHSEEGAASTSAAVERLRERIEVTPVGDGTWRLAYVDVRRDTAPRVVERIVIHFRDALLDVERLPENPIPSLATEIQALEGRLVEQKKKLGQLGGRSPHLASQLTATINAINAADTQLRAVRDSIRRERARRLLMERRLGAPVPAQSAEAHVEAAVGARASPPGGSGRVAQPGALEPMDRELLALQDQEAVLSTRIALSEGKMLTLGGRNSGLLTLTREFTALRTTYANLLAERETARHATDVERLLLGSGLTVIRPPSLPAQPYNARQRALVSAALGVGCLAVGVAVVGLFDYRYRTFASKADLGRALALPVLAAVPAMQPQVELAGHRRRGRLWSRS
jgi:uncharacterized protein involved in exopolysaccharide biosynthesis